MLSRTSTATTAHSVPRQPGRAGVAKSSTPSTGSSPCSAGGAVSTETGTAPSFPCRECSGAGELEYMGLYDTEYHWRTCHKCEGSGVEDPYCETCEGPLTSDGFCYSCDDYSPSQLVEVERLGPGRVAA